VERAIFQYLRDLVYRHSGIHLSEGEQRMLESRINPRWADLGLSSAREDVDLLAGPRGRREISSLIDLVTVNHTAFFRENRQFQVLRAELLPRILAAKGRVGKAAVWAWSAGCSSGEEAYSMAVCLAEAENRGERSQDRVLGTDINRRVLRVAARGVYPAMRLTGFPEEYRYKYLLRDDSTPPECYRLCPEIRQMVSFRRLNSLSRVDSFRGRFDLIFCRNVISYFDERAMGKLAGNFFRALASGGFLFIGEKETLASGVHGLDRVAPSIFRKS
jgi:chemotaxis protein methyltransferase CheR